MFFMIKSYCQEHLLDETSKYYLILPVLRRQTIFSFLCHHVNNPPFASILHIDSVCSFVTFKVCTEDFRIFTLFWNSSCTSGKNDVIFWRLIDKRLVLKSPWSNPQEILFK